MKIEVKGSHGILNIFGPYEPSESEIAALCEALRVEQQRIIEEARRLLYSPPQLTEKK